MIFAKDAPKLFKQKLKGSTDENLVISSGAGLDKTGVNDVRFWINKND